MTMLLQPLYVLPGEVPKKGTKQCNILGELFHFFICLSYLYVTANWKVIWGVNVAFGIIIFINHKYYYCVH